MVTPPNRPGGPFSIDGAKESRHHFCASSRSHLGNTTHSSSARAISNVNHGGHVVNIIGHGQPGVLFAGCGDNTGAARTTTKFDQVEPVSLDPFAALSGDVTDIVLWGCEVAATASGRRLLLDIAERTGATVWAPADIIQWCGNSILTNQCEAIRWDSRRRGQAPSPLLELSMPPNRDPVTEMRLPGGFAFRINDIVGLRIEALADVEQSKDVEPIEAAREFIASFGISEFPGGDEGPAAITTHHLHVTIGILGMPVVFGLFNSRYLYPLGLPGRFTLLSRQALTSNVIVPV